MPSLLDQAEASLRRLRSDLDRMWSLAYQPLGLFFFGIGLVTLASYISQWMDSYLTVTQSVWGAAGFVIWCILGAVHFWSPLRLRAFQGRSQGWFARRFRRRPIPDSRLAEVVEQLSMMRKEVGQVRSNEGTTWVLGIFIGLLSGGIAAFSLYSAIVHLGLSPWTWQDRALEAAYGLGILGWLSIFFLTMYRCHRSFRDGLHDLTRIDWVLWSWQNAFWSRYAP